MDTRVFLFLTRMFDPFGSRTFVGVRVCIFILLQDAEIRYLKIFYGKKNTNLKFIFENNPI